MVAPRDQCRAGWRAERGGVELRVAQSSIRDAIHRGCRNDSAEGAGRCEADVLGHDEQNIGSSLRRNNGHRLGGLRLSGIELNLAIKFLWWW